MSSEPVLEVSDVVKDYELGELASLSRTLHSIRSFVRRERPERPHVRAVNGVSFELRAGESLALLGRNGSGKSTMAGMIAGAIVPTEGRIRLRGTVMPLLSVGAGFNAELTGRENILLFGRILGLPRSVVVEAIDDIADFAEIKRAHLGTPTKRYSSGMRARLSFAAALRLPADIYILDEVLATADDGFKERAAEQLDELRRDGAALIFVSHEMTLLERVCQRGVWLHDGRVHRQGEMHELAGDYAAFLEEWAAEKRQERVRRQLRPLKPTQRLRMSKGEA